MNKSFEFISVSKAMQVAAVRNGQVADVLVARIEVRDLFNDTCFYLEGGLETEENAETILRQKVENCQTMEELIGGFNQQLRELGGLSQRCQSTARSLFCRDPRCAGTQPASHQIGVYRVL